MLSFYKHILYEMTKGGITVRILFWYIPILSSVSIANYNSWIINRSPSALVRLFDIFQKDGVCHSLKEVEINCTAVTEYECTDNMGSDTCYRSVYTSCSTFVCERRHRMIKDPLWNDLLPNSPLECNNGGYVRYSPGDTSLSCICPNNFGGTYCDIPICENGCKNGGTCVQHYVSTKCICPDGFTGDNCETDSRSVVCGSLPSSSGVIHKQCSEMSRCNSWEVCCEWQKEQRCVHLNTTRQICLYFGRTHYSGDKITTNDGKYCECLPLTFKFGTVKCKDMEPGLSNASIPDKKKIVPSDYREPIISNCPTHPVYVPLDDNRNFGSYRTKLLANDYKGNRLQVTISKSHFTSCTCIGKEGDHYIVEAVTAADIYGKRGRCEFIAKIKDITPPIFKSCPSTIYASSNQEVTWEEPVVFDNVDVRSLKLLGTYKRGKKYSVGEHLLTYIATDWHDNNSKCQFFIIVKENFKHESWML